MRLVVLAVTGCQALVAKVGLNNEFFYGPLRDLLNRRDTPEFGREVSEGTISTLIRLVRSEREVHRVAREVLGLAVSRMCPADAEDYYTMALKGVNATHRQDFCAFDFLARIQFMIGRPAEAIRTLEEAMLLEAKPYNQKEAQRVRDLLEDYRKRRAPLQLRSR